MSETKLGNILNFAPPVHFAMMAPRTIACRHVVKPSGLLPSRGQWLRLFFIVAVCLWPWRLSLGATFQEIQLTTNATDESDIMIEGDSLGRIHIVYAREGSIYYQCRHYEGPCLVPEERVSGGSSASLALDPSGEPQVVAVSSGLVYYASRPDGVWTSTLAGSAISASLDIMEDGQVYVAYSHLTSGRSSISLARIVSNQMVSTTGLFGGYEETYNCSYKTFGVHNDFTDPVLACANGVIHVAAKHIQARDAGYIPGQSYCEPRSDKRAAYCRLDSNSMQTSFSPWSSYQFLMAEKNWFCLSGDGTPHLLYWIGWDQVYCESFFPWNAVSGPISHVAAIDSARSGQTGAVVGNCSLYLRENNAFQPGFLISTQTVAEVDLCMEYAAIASIQEKTPGTKEVFLWVNLDLDGDGISDGWEQHYLGGFTNVVGETNSDGDALTDREEYLAGTDPWDSNSVFKLESMATDPDSGSALLSWPGSVARLYTLHITTNWGFSWTNMGDCTDQPGQGTPVIITNPTASSSQAWYKATVRLAP